MNKLTALKKVSLCIIGLGFILLPGCADRLATLSDPEPLATAVPLTAPTMIAERGDVEWDYMDTYQFQVSLTKEAGTFDVINRY
jgi:hypothetical protein